MKTMGKILANTHDNGKILSTNENNEKNTSKYL